FSRAMPLSFQLLRRAIGQAYPAEPRLLQAWLRIDALKQARPGTLRKRRAVISLARRERPARSLIDDGGVGRRHVLAWQPERWVAWIGPRLRVRIDRGDPHLLHAAGDLAEERRAGQRV